MSRNPLDQIKNLSCHGVYLSVHKVLPKFLYVYPLQTLYYFLLGVFLIGFIFKS